MKYQVSMPKFKIENIPDGKVKMMNKSRQTSAQAAVRAINALNKKIYHGYDFRSLYERWESGEWPMATVNGKFRHEVIKDYEDTLSHLDGIAYNMVRERVCNSIINYLGLVSRVNFSVAIVEARETRKELKEVQDENARLRAALREIAESYVLNDQVAIAKLLEQHL